jgi:hypothetical protein
LRELGEVKATIEETTRQLDSERLYSKRIAQAQVVAVVAIVAV